MRDGANKYAVIDKTTTEIAARGLKTRKDARIAKRELEYKNSAANEFRQTPSRYFVETDVDHENGAGLYCR